MAKELPVFSLAKSDQLGNEFMYCRVFCQRQEPPPLRLLLDYLKSRGQVPLIPKMDPEALDDWAWVQVALGYHRERKPIQLFCIRDRGTYKDVFEQEQKGFSGQLAAFGDEEAQLAREFVVRARFIATTRLIKQDITEEGYDFNGWILEFFQDNCNGIVQIDGQGFFSPKGELVVDLREDPIRDFSTPEITPPS
ncbi:MAG: hypothetical protein D6704_03020 [Nitrospirae bacterium]|nr:MAG: hypothetical protein D6704_03020 [Nitrospirota bacterium]